MLSSSHFLIAVVIHEVDPAIYAATSSNACRCWNPQEPTILRGQRGTLIADCAPCFLLPHIIPLLLESRIIKSNKYFSRCFSSKKKGTLRRGILKAGTIFLPKLNSLCFFFGGASRYSTGIGVRPDSLTSTVLGAVLLVVEATRKSAQLKFNWVSCRE